MRKTIHGIEVELVKPTVVGQLFAVTIKINGKGCGNLVEEIVDGVLVDANQGKIDHTLYSSFVAENIMEGIWKLKFEHLTRREVFSDVGRWIYTECHNYIKENLKNGHK